MPTIFLVVSASVYVGMMIHVFVHLYRGTLPRRIVLWVTYPALLVCLLMGYILYERHEHAYLEIHEVLTIILMMLTTMAAFEIRFMLGLQYVKQIDILSSDKSSCSYTKWFAFVGFASMCVMVTIMLATHQV